MKKQIKTVLVVIVGLIVTSLLFGCASTGPAFGQPTAIQQLLNEAASNVPINIAGNQVRLSFEGDFWRGKVSGQDRLAGECNITETADGALITLDQSWAFVNVGPVSKWQKTPGPKIYLEYKKGPPVSFTKVD